MSYRFAPPLAGTGPTDARPVSARHAADAYDATGAAYLHYADGTNAQPLEFSSRYAFADRTLWSRIEASLVSMHASRRRAIRILDIGCGPGTWTVRTARRAAQLGFTAIECRGIDPSPAMIALAKQAAASAEAPAIEMRFEIADLHSALASEDDHGADLVLCLYGVFNHLAAPLRASAAQALARVNGGTLIVTARSVGSLPTIYVAGIEQAARYVQDNDTDRMEVDLADGTHLAFDSHLFSARELVALFAPHCPVRELTGLDLFHSRFAYNPAWNPAGANGTETADRLARLEQLCAADEILIDSAAHIMLVAEPHL
jgi:SAM-dependent methyltransferase